MDNNSSDTADDDAVADDQHPSDAATAPAASSTSMVTAKSAWCNPDSVSLWLHVDTLALCEYGVCHGQWVSLLQDTHTDGYASVLLYQWDITN